MSKALIVGGGLIAGVVGLGVGPNVDTTVGATNLGNLQTQYNTCYIKGIGTIPGTPNQCKQVIDAGTELAKSAIEKAGEHVDDAKAEARELWGAVFGTGGVAAGAVAANRRKRS